MQGFIRRRLVSSEARLRQQTLHRCSISQVAHQKHDADDVNGSVSLPKMPPFAYTPPPYTGPSTEEILAQRKEYLSPSMFYFYNKPLNIVDGRMQYLFDEKGRRYLDGFGGIATVSCGHCHPDVVEAIVNQTNKIQHSTILYLNHAIGDFAQALTAKLPANLKVVFFTNSGTEANKLAMLIARLYTGCHDIISLRNAYHGNAAGTMGATAQANWKFNVIQTGVHHAMNPGPYRGVFGSDGEKYAKDVQDLIDFGTSGHVAAFMCEAIQGVGGIIELAPGYLPAVYNSVKKAGGLFIADEVQSGFARTGSNFWGFEGHGVVPDIVTMAKGIGNGIPLGAVVTTPEVAEVLTRRNYFNTFGGNPVCTAAGLAVLKVIEKEGLQKNALVVGSYLKERLTSLKDKYERKPSILEHPQRGQGIPRGIPLPIPQIGITRGKRGPKFLFTGGDHRFWEEFLRIGSAATDALTVVIGDVRGKGLMLGVELVTDTQLKTPAKAETIQVMDRMKDLGVLIGKGGFYGNVFRITPPLCFTKEDADFLVDTMDYTMSKV